MGFQASQIRYRAKPLNVSIAPYYGLSADTTVTSALVLGLTGRGPTAGQINTDFNLDAVTGTGHYMYFAYPAAYGSARFLDIDSNFYGGWDGANNDPENIYGPVLVNVSIGGTPVPFYVYRTDYPELGYCRWRAEAEPG